MQTKLEQNVMDVIRKFHMCVAFLHRLMRMVDAGEIVLPDDMLERLIEVCAL